MWFTKKLWNDRNFPKAKDAAPFLPWLEGFQPRSQSLKSGTLGPLGR